jgi:nicotinamide mononucleotide transporter
MEMKQLEQMGFELLNTTFPEWIAVFSGLIYVILIARKKIAAWFFAAVSSSIYVYLCFISDYFLETILQLFYLFMAFWGWYKWNQNKKEDQFIRSWNLKQHLINISISLLITIVFAFFFDVFTRQELPYLDAFTTVFSIGATFMVAQRVLENWIYWIVIDLVSIRLYAYKDLNLTALLFLIYTIVAIAGYYRWYKLYKAQNT